MKAKRAKPRRTFNPIRLQDGSVKRAEYRVGVDLRQLAKGRPCMVRLQGCDGGGETTILAHFRNSGLNGIGMKPPDWCGAWACFSCHEQCDFRAGSMVTIAVRFHHLMGVLRTLAKLIEEGVIKVGT